ncbi:MAG: GspH/FimT family pseudopilin [Nitrospirota bacterium]|nr:GspH/FimT family pseudopilin [Nitrospirota bacterium]
MVRNGYTITELLVVLSMVAIVAGLGGGWLSSQIPAYRLNGAARLIRSDLLSARMQAVTQGNEFRVIFDEPFQYIILDDDNNNGKREADESIASRDLRDDYHGVSFDANNNPIFHPRGIASSLATITLSNAVGEKSITVSMTGRVRIRASQ